MLSSQYAPFDQAITQAYNAVLITTAELDFPGPEIVYANPAFCRQTGYTEQELIGQTPRILQGTDTDRKVLDRLRVEIADGQFFDGQTVNYRKDGSPYWVRWNISPVLDAQGNITYYVSVQQDITELKKAEQTLQTLAFRDALTDLYTFTGFTRCLQQHVDQNGWHPGSAIVTLDIARLRDINDVFGYADGDELLITYGQRLIEQVGVDGIVGRRGGDEFILYIHPRADKSLSAYLEKIASSLSAPFSLSGNTVKISCRLGYTYLGNSPRPLQDLLHEAEQALFQHRVETSAPWIAYNARLREQSLHRVTLTHALRTAIEQEQFELHFQPKVALATGQLIACEALIRWNHPTRGLLSPGAFISVAEQSQLIVQIGDWVLRRACQYLKTWRDDGLKPVRVSVNVSMIQFQHGHFAHQVQTILKQSGVVPDELVLEITESVFGQNSDDVLHQLHQLRDMGVRLSLDDFGTGYSSLLYLQRYPFDEIKIDQGFVFQLLDDPFSQSIVETVMHLASALEADVIAEGIESRAVSQALQTMGCQYGQGYFYSMPLEAEDFRWLLEQRRCLPLTQHEMS